MSNESLLLKNIFLALTYQTPNFPSTLHECGYDEVFIEKAFTNSRLENVDYDFAACAPACNRSILAEFKGGDYNRPEALQRLNGQIQRYSAVTGEDVVQKAGFSVAQGLNPLQHEPQTLIVGVDGHTTNIEASISAPTTMPILAVKIDVSASQYGGLLRVRGTCNDSELDRRLGPLSQQYDIPTTLPFDKDSRNVDIADAIMPAILQFFYLSPTTTTFEVQDVLGRAISIWPLIDSTEQGAYIGRVRRVMNDLAGHEFRGWFEWDDHERKWRTLRSLGSSHGDRMRMFRRLQGVQQQALIRLGGGQLQQQVLPAADDNLSTP